MLRGMVVPVITIDEHLIEHSLIIWPTDYYKKKIDKT